MKNLHGQCSFNLHEHEHFEQFSLEIIILNIIRIHIYISSKHDVNFLLIYFFLIFRMGDIQKANVFSNVFIYAYII